MTAAARLSRRRFLHSSLFAAAAALPAVRAWPAILGLSSSVDRDLEAITADGRGITLTRASVQELGDSLRGNLLLPGHPAYDPARRVWNAQVDKRPALIVQPRGAADVRSAVQFARASNLLVAVKCGGHSPSGKSACERGMLIDLSLLRGVRVDPAVRVARVAGGSLLGDLDHEAMLGGNIMFPLKQAKSVLSFYAEQEGTLRDDLYMSAVLVSNAGFSGVSGVAFSVCYSGPANEADKVLRFIRSAGKPMFDALKPIDYVELQRSGDLDETRAVGSYMKTGFVRQISPKLVDVMIAGHEENPERSTNVGFQHCGGAISRVAPDATAFPHRGIHATSLMTADWPATVDPEPHLKWLRKYWAAIEPHTAGFYTNDIVDESQKQVDENYLGNYPRLVALKSRHDPTNLFRLNANVLPKV